MSGGIAYVYDPDATFAGLVNHEMVELEPLDDDDLAELRSIVERHGELTGSTVAEQLLLGWTAEAPHFRKVMPKDYRRVLAVLREAEEAGLSEGETMTRVMEAAHG
jgi:glutamate synthase (NADPH/NADH) large chain